MSVCVSVRLRVFVYVCLCVFAYVCQCVFESVAPGGPRGERPLNSMSDGRTKEEEVEGPLSEKELTIIITGVKLQC